jgi:hypothetical protein
MSHSDTPSTQLNIVEAPLARGRRSRPKAKASPSIREFRRANRAVLKQYEELFAAVKQLIDMEHQLMAAGKVAPVSCGVLPFRRGLINDN